MLADGQYVDGSWLLNVYIDDLHLNREIRVQGNWSIGELLVQLTDGLNVPERKELAPNEICLNPANRNASWSDYCLWWSTRNRWLLKTKMSLNEYGLQADAYLRLISVYGKLHVQLPDLQIREFADVNYAESVFRVTLSICRYLNIRHPEELSLSHLVRQDDLKHPRFVTRPSDRRSGAVTSTGRYGTFQRSATINTAFKTSHRELIQKLSGNLTNGDMTADHSVKSNGTVSIKQNGAVNHERRCMESESNSSVSSKTSSHIFGPPRIRDRRANRFYYCGANRYSRPISDHFGRLAYSPGSLHTVVFETRLLEDPTLASSPLLTVDETLQKGFIVRPTNFAQRVRLHANWLDSSKSLMEQGIDFTYDPLNINQDLIQSPNHRHHQSPSRDQKNRSTSPINYISVWNRQSSPVSRQSVNTKLVPMLALRYKYGTFYDLNIKYDAIRINQLYEQAKWSIITESLEVTDEEACLFAALQAQVELSSEREALLNDQLDSNSTDNADPNNDAASHKSDQTQLNVNGKCSLQKRLLNLKAQTRDISPLGGYLRSGRSVKYNSRPLSTIGLEEEIDMLFEELAINSVEQSDKPCLRHKSRSKKRTCERPYSLFDEGGSDSAQLMNEPDLPEIKSYVKIYKPRRLGIKVFKRYFIGIRGMNLYVSKNETEFDNNAESNEIIHLPGCEVQSNLCVSSERFIIRLFVPITRTNLPLSTLFNLGPVEDRDDVDSGIGHKLRRRASLLALTSLSNIGSAFNIVATSGLNGYLNTASGTGNLTGISATVIGLMNEIWLRFNDLNSYIDWLAIFRLLTSISVPTFHNTKLDTDTLDTNQVKFKIQLPFDTSYKYVLNRTVLDAERRAISNLIMLLSSVTSMKSLKVNQPDQVVNVNQLYKHLEKRLNDMLPIRLGNWKHFSCKAWDHLRDHSTNTLPNKSASLAAGQLKSPSHHSTVQICSNLVQNIGATYANIIQLTSYQAKLKYINAWEQLPLHGIALFPARIEVTLPLCHLLGPDVYMNSEFGGWIPGLNRTTNSGYVTVASSRRLEVVGINPYRIFRFDMNTGDMLASWRLSSIQGWHINRELSELMLLLANSQQQKSEEANKQSVSPTRDLIANEYAGKIIIRPVDVSVKTVAEYLGGCIFLNLRSPEKNQCLAEDTFYKLTTGLPLPST